jgi:hypothetical protein
MDRHVFLAAPLAEGALTVFYDINSGHYECEIENVFVATIGHNEQKEWVDVKTGEASEFSRKVGAMIDKQLVAG